VTLHVHRSPGNIIFAGDDAWTVGSPRLTDRVGEVELRVSARSFLQANHDAAGWICRRIASRLAGARGLILDLYSGVGAIAFHLVGPDRHVVAVEEAPHAVADARASASGRITSPLSLVSESAERFLADPGQFVPEASAVSIAAVIVNPPRAGLTARVLEALVALAPPVIAYVSCKLATLARDLEVLAPVYAIDELTPVDMMPLTPHVEALAILERRPG
jgi:23S rRNA (uracil1939-C5)-methyltransferase